jgi:hypothetical protein
VTYDARTNRRKRTMPDEPLTLRQEVMMNARNPFATSIAAVIVLMAVAALWAQQQPSSAITGTNYLYIEEFEIPAGIAPNDAIAEASQWTRDIRKTGEYKNVRLFIHNTGPVFALYVMAEPNNWQAIETGANKFFAARPDIMAKPIRWGRHSDNLLSEIRVE